MNEYYLEFEGKRVELPSFNVKVADTVAKTDVIKFSESTYITKVKSYYDMEVQLLGKETVVELVGDINDDKVDCNQIVLLQQAIVDAYNKPIDEMQAKAVNDKLSQYDLDKIVQLADNLKK